VVEGLKAIAPYAEEKNITLSLEPLNVLVDHAGYYLVTSEQGFQVIDEVGSPQIKLLYDIYHQQITEGNILATICANMDKIGHLHVADVPGRQEPGTGELNYQNIFSRIADSDYQGYVGLEFKPSTTSEEALAKVLKIAGLA
jgi:hydroxypyruvate isomerase